MNKIEIKFIELSFIFISLIVLYNIVLLQSNLKNNYKLLLKFQKMRKILYS